MKIWIITILIIIVIILLLRIVLKFNSILRNLAYKSFLRVEKLYISGHGKEKMDETLDYVVESLNSISVVGPIITIFLNKKTLRNILQKMFDEVKDFLDNGKNDNSIKKEEIL